MVHSQGVRSREKSRVKNQVLSCSVRKLNPKIRGKYFFRFLKLVTVFRVILKFGTCSLANQNAGFSRITDRGIFVFRVRKTFTPENIWEITIELLHVYFPSWVANVYNNLMCKLSNQKVRFVQCEQSIYHRMNPHYVLFELEYHTIVYSPLQRVKQSYAPLERENLNEAVDNGGTRNCLAWRIFACFARI